MKRLVILLLFIITTQGLLHAQKSVVDSLFTELNIWQNKSDTNLYNIYYSLGEQFQNSNPDTAIYFYQISIDYARKQKDELKEGESIRKLGWSYFLKSDFSNAMEKFNESLFIANKYLSGIQKQLAKKLLASNMGNIGGVYLNQGNYTKALEYYFKALKIDKEIGNKLGQAIIMGNIGIVYSDQSYYTKALEYYFKALKMDEEIVNKSGQARHLGNIGLVYSDQSYYTKALEYYFKALVINEEIGDKRAQAANTGNIGLVYSEQGDCTKALDYYFKALKMEEEIGNKSGQAKHLGNIGFVYSARGDYVRAMEYYFKSQKIAEEIGDKRSQAINIGNIGVLYFKQKKYKSAEVYLQKAISIAEDLKIVYTLKYVYSFLSELYIQTGRHKESLESYKTYIMYRDSLNNEENQKAIVQKEMQYEYDKKEAMLKAEQEKKDAIVKADKQRHQLFILLIGAVAAAISIIALLVYRSLTFTKKQKQIIQQQKHLVEEKQKEILDSIHYAKRIQMALLTSEYYIDKNLKRLKN